LITPRTLSLAHSHNVVNTQPPSPPPEPDSDSSANQTPRRNGWLWLLLLLLLMGLIGTCLYFYVTWLDTAAMSPSFTQLSVFVLERYFQKGRSYVSLYGLQYSKILLLAVSSHSSCIFLYRRSYRLRSLVYTRLSACLNYCSREFLGSLCLLASVSRLRWVLWAIYTYGSVLLMLASIAIDRHILSFYQPTKNSWCLSLTERSVRILKFLLKSTDSDASC
jgi:hypothetical protein